MKTDVKEQMLGSRGQVSEVKTDVKEQMLGRSGQVYVVRMYVREQIRYIASFSDFSGC